MRDVTLHRGDCLSVLRTLEAGSVDAVVTDPPYALTSQASMRRSCFPGRYAGTAGETRGFMGKKWDGKLPGIEHWQAALRVLKPGGYLLAFGGTRTFHRLACALEDAGFEMRDTLMWLYGSGFPKGRGCLKPAWEPVLLCRRPEPKVLPLGVEECRVGTGESRRNIVNEPKNGRHPGVFRQGSHQDSEPTTAGRWPANLILSEEAARLLDEQAGESVSRAGARGSVQRYDPAAEVEAKRPKGGNGVRGHTDSGGPSRFFYCPKAPRRERAVMADGTRHPTQKPEALMRWLVRLACPGGGVVLDSFMGSGTTGVACVQTGRKFIGVELDPTYFAIAEQRIAAAQAGRRAA